jgi:hypothetical protein
MSNIFTRSPFNVTLTGSAGEEVEVRLFIWNGTGAAPANPQRTLSKPIPSSLITEVVFNISPYIREYITLKNDTGATNYNTLGTGTAVHWANCKVDVYLNGVSQSSTTYKCFDGYTEFTDGANYDRGNIFLDEGTYYYYYDASQNPSSNDWDRVGRITLVTGSVNYTKVKWTNLETAATTTSNFPNNERVSSCPCITPTYLADGCKTEILDDTNTVIATYYFIPQEECKYSPIKMSFVNKYGQWQRVDFFKASVDTFDVIVTPYNYSVSTWDYGVEYGQTREMNINGQQSITVNTGWVTEDYKEIIKQILLSERRLIYITDTRDRTIQIPVTLKSTNVTLQKHINYKLDFQFAFDHLNNAQ